MATEIFTNYPIREFREGFGYETDTMFKQQIERRLGAIEDRLSRIEELMTKFHTKE